MFQHILLATDLSDASEHAFCTATALARALAARLTVLHVYEVSAGTLGCTPDAEAERTWPGAIRIRELLDGLVTGLRATGLRAEGVIRFGSAARRIAEVARERNVDLVVTGTRGRTGVARFWYGSVAEQVLRRSSAPVLTVPMRSRNVIGMELRRGTERPRPAPLGRSARGAPPISTRF